MPPESEKWDEFLKGTWRVERFYVDDGTKHHHMLLRRANPRAQMNLASTSGYFRGLVEGDTIVIELVSPPQRPVDDAWGYPAEYFYLKTVTPRP